MVFYDSEDSWSGNFSLYLERSELQIWNTNKIEVMFTIPFWSNHWFHYILAASENSWCFIQYVSSVIGVQKDQIWDLIIYVSASPSRVRTWILCSKEKKSYLYLLKLEIDTIRYKRNGYGDRVWIQQVYDKKKWTQMCIEYIVKYDEPTKFVNIKWFCFVKVLD